MHNKKPERPDYSELVRATLENDKVLLNKILESISDTSIHYLLYHMNSSRADAEDCTQQAILDTLEKIKALKIKDPERIIPYIKTCCRNNYFRKVRYNNKLISNDHFSYLSEPPNQLEDIMKSEESEILKTCLESLNDNYREFLTYFITFPGVDASQVAKHFNMSVISVWSKKHRIIKKLAQCIQNKMSK
ncbi:MAG: sigma-70 family RNA polymerase sigma factor [Balneolales bacterium]